MTLFYSLCPPRSFPFFFFTLPATPYISTLSLHDALPICYPTGFAAAQQCTFYRICGISESDSQAAPTAGTSRMADGKETRSEEHTSELQSLRHLVCRLLLEKKKKKKQQTQTP